MLNSTEDWD